MYNEALQEEDEQREISLGSQLHRLERKKESFLGPSNCISFLIDDDDVDGLLFITF